MTLIARPNGLHLSRFGFTASRAVGNAVARNRARRLMRESVRQLYPRVEPGWDVMLLARARMAGVKEGTVREALVGLLTRAGLLENCDCRMEELGSG
jgi:ribonuclease P protein component